MLCQPAPVSVLARHVIPFFRMARLLCVPRRCSQSVSARCFEAAHSSAKRKTHGARVSSSLTDCACRRRERENKREREKERRGEREKERKREREKERKREREKERKREREKERKERKREREKEKREGEKGRKREGEKERRGEREKGREGGGERGRGREREKNIERERERELRARAPLRPFWCTPRTPVPPCPPQFFLFWSSWCLKAKVVLGTSAWALASFFSQAASLASPSILTLPASLAEGPGHLALPWRHRRALKKRGDKRRPESQESKSKSE